MKRLIVAAIVILVVSATAFAGPFGLDMGMTLKDVGEVCLDEPEYIADDRYYIQPKKSHPLFEGYVVWINEDCGLYYIKGISKEIRTTDYGTEVKQEFTKLLSPLERKYGKFKRIDRLSKDTPSYNRTDKDWMRTIADGSRTYEAHWEAKESNIKEFEGLVSIATGIKTEKTYVTNKAYIWIEYGFINAIKGFYDLDDVL